MTDENDNKKTYTYEEVKKSSLKYFNGDEMAAQVFVGKYALHDEEGKYVELSPEDMHKRLAKEFARIEKKYPNPLSYEEILGYFKNFKYIIPQGSPMAGIGNPYTVMSISNCFVIESPHDSYGGIMKTDQELAHVFRRRGGCGVDISTIRPRGMSTNNAAKTTDGISIFMDRYSNTCREVAQSGRRGAEMITISVHHPEIETFVNIKRNRNRVTGANISIRLSDEFMEAVKNDNDFQLRWPVDSKDPQVVKNINAKKLWNEIIESAHGHAEPGLLFWDVVKKWSPADIYSDFGFGSISVNPCLASDTWIMTNFGPRQISQLIDKPYNAMVDGKSYKSNGFFKTGNKKIYKVKTSHGYELKGTENHRLLTENGGWKEIKDLTTEDKLVLQTKNSVEWGGEGTFQEGWLVGEMVGDGCYNPEKYYGRVCFWGENKNVLAETAKKYVTNLKYNFRSDFKGGLSNHEKNDKIVVVSKALDKLAERFIEPKTKNLLNTVELSSSEFCKGFLRGIFDADGSVQGDLLKGTSIRLTQNNLNRLVTVQRMLLRFGIVSKIYQNRKPSGNKLMPDGHGGHKEYFCNEFHELCISKNMIDLFVEKIGFEDQTKQKKANEIIKNRLRPPYKTTNTTSFVCAEECGYEDVYDCTVEDVHMFDANGITAHNCGEILLCPDDSCRLMLLNLTSYVMNPFNSKKAEFDFDKFYKHSIVAQRLMDDMIDLELECLDKILSKIESDPEPDDVKAIEKNLWLKIKETTIKGRRTGLGVTGVGDAIAALGLTYGSDDSIEMVGNLYKKLALGSYRSSVTLAKERGAFPIYDYNLEKEHPFINRIMDEDPELKKDWMEYGRRNIANTTTAPCGSVSILTQTTSGIEPTFMVSYKRRKKINPSDKNAKVDFVDDLGDKWQEYVVYHLGFKKWMEANNKTEDDFKQSPYFNGTAMDVDWRQSVKLQAAAQKWVCHSISKTCNLPSDVSKDVVADVYMSAWESGCKGFTVYRDGCRDGVLLTNESSSPTEKASEEKEEPKLSDNHAPKRPESLPCEIYHMQVKGEKWNIFVGLLDKRPFEIFAGRAEFVSIPKSKKEGVLKKNGKYNLHIGEGDNEIVVKDVARVFENPTEAAFTRTLSLSLRHGIPVQYVVEQIEKGADKDSDMFSLAKGIMRVLKHYIKDGTKASLKKCETCGSPDLVYEEGCISCKGCGWSKCS